MTKKQLKYGYKDETMLNMGKYIILIDGFMCFYKTQDKNRNKNEEIEEKKDNYINYFTGDIIPSVVSG